MLWKKGREVLVWRVLCQATPWTSSETTKRLTRSQLPSGQPRDSEKKGAKKTAQITTDLAYDLSQSSSCLGSLFVNSFMLGRNSFPHAYVGLLFFFLCLASSSSAESAKHIHWEHIQNIHRFFSSAASTHLFAGASSDLSSRLIYHQTVGLCGPNRGSVCHACKGFSVRPSVCSSYNLWSSKSPLSTYISGPESIKTCLLVFSPKLASLTGKISVRLLGTLIEPFAGVQRWTEDDEFSQMIGNEAYQIKNMQSSLKDFVRIVRARDGICTLIRKSHCSLPAHAPWN